MGAVLKGSILKAGEMHAERTGGTFRSPWVARRVILTDYGLYIFEQGKRGKSERGALVLMIPIETVNGVKLESDKKKHYVVLATFLKDHRLLQSNEGEAMEWRRLVQQAILARRKQATVRGSRVGTVGR